MTVKELQALTRQMAKNVQQMDDQVRRIANLVQEMFDHTTIQAHQQNVINELLTKHIQYHKDRLNKLDGGAA